MIIEFLDMNLCWVANRYVGLERHDSYMAGYISIGVASQESVKKAQEGL